MEREVAGYTFKDPRLLEMALTHGSYVHEHPQEEGHDLERLEFLGDAVIDLVAGDDLYRRYPDASEGELTVLRARVVSGEALAAVSRRLGLPERARLGRGELESGGRERVGLAASVLESVIGAVYVDGGFAATKELVLRIMREELDATVTAPRKSPKSLLQEWAQAEKQPLPVYTVIEERGPEHRRDFVVEVEAGGRVARGSGQSKREAEEAAAAELVRALDMGAAFAEERP